MFRKRFIALVMALTMLFTLMAPALTFATGAGSEEETTGTGTSEVTEETNEQGSDTDPDEGDGAGNDAGDTNTGADNTGDTGTGDAGADNTGDTGTGDSDTGTGDTGTGDTGTGNAGTGDTGTGNAGTGDTGTSDTGTGDTGTDETLPPATVPGDGDGEGDGEGDADKGGDQLPSDGDLGEEEVEKTRGTTEPTTITVAIISYVNRNRGTTGWTVHYWDDASNGGDAPCSLTNPQTVVKHSLDGYWENAPKDFLVYTATIPAGVTGYEIHKDGNKINTDFNTDLSNKGVYVFEYGDVYHTQFVESIGYTLGAITVYYKTTWDQPRVHYWFTDGGSVDFGGTTWPGVYMTPVQNQVNKFKATIPANVGGLLFNNGSGDQTVDIRNGIENGAFWRPNGNSDTSGHLYVEPANITITFNLNEGNIGDDTNNVEVTIQEGDCVSAPNPAPTKAGCRFIGWSLSNNNELFNFEQGLYTNAILYAQYKQLYTVTAGEVDGTVTADKAQAVEGETVTLAVTPEEGYQVGEVKYNGTVINPDNGVYSFTMPAENVVVTATFSPIVAKIGDTGYETLQAAVNAAAGQTGNVTITLIADTHESVRIVQIQDLNLTVEGQSNTLYGMLSIYGGGRFNGADTLTINGLNVAYDSTYSTKNALISFEGYGENGWSSAHKVTVKDVTFTGNPVKNEKGEYPLNAVVIPSKSQSNTIVFQNLTASYVHSLLNTQGVTNLTVTGCKATDHIDSGISISGGSGTHVISNNTITAEENNSYGIRIQSGGNGESTISGNTVTATNALVISCGTNTVASGTYNGNVTMMGKNNENAGKLIISSADAGNPTYINGTLTAGNAEMIISGGLFSEQPALAYCAEGLYPVANTDASTNAAYPYTVGAAIALVDGLGYATFEAAVTAANGEKSIKLLANIAEEYTLKAGETLKVEHNGKTLTVKAPAHYTVQTTEADGVTTYTLLGDPCTITFINGYTGETLHTEATRYGDPMPTYVPNPLPTREGYDLDVNNLWTPVPGETVTGSIVYSLNWIEQHTVTFDANGGTLMDENNQEVTSITKKVSHNGTVEAPTPTREGHTFLGWFDGNNEFDFTKPVHDSFTLQAHWQINQYTVTFMDGGTVLATFTEDFGTAITAPEVPARAGWIFKGWDVEVPATIPAGDLTIHTVWAEAVAKIGDVLYDTLAGAIEAVQSNETIVILKDLDCTGLTITLPDGVTGVTIKGEDPDNYVTLTDLTGMAKTNSYLTFENIKFDRKSVMLTMSGSHITFNHCDFVARYGGVDLTTLNNADNFEFNYCNFKGVRYDGGRLISSPSCTNLTFDHCTLQNGFAALYYGFLKGDVYVKDTTIDVYAYVFHTGADTANQVRYHFENDTISGWFSYGKDVESAEFKNCYFKYNENAYACYVAPYGDTIFDGCTFDNGFKVEVKNAGKVATFKDSSLTVDGESKLITAANIDTLIDTDSVGAFNVVIATVGESNYYGIVFDNKQAVAPDMTEAVDAAYAASEFAAGTYTFYCDPNPVFEAKDEYKGKYAAYQDETTKTWIVYKLVTSITLAPTELVFVFGDTATQTLTATIVPDEALNKEIVWTSSDETVATVDEDGVVTPAGQGTATITVALKAQPDMKAEATVVVAVAKIEKDGETTYYPTLQAAVTAAYGKTGNVTITVLKDLTENVTIQQQRGLNLTVDGGNHTIKGQFLLDGGGFYGDDTLTIKSFNFKYEGATMTSGTDAFVYVLTSGTLGRLSDTHNVTVKDSTFDGDGSNQKFVAVKATSGTQNKNFILENLTAKNVHSLAQLTAVNGITITGCNATEGVHNGINISGGAGSATISGNTIVAEGYSIRLKGGSSMAVTLTDNTFSGSEGIVSEATGGGTITVVDGKYAGPLPTDGAKFTVKGGVFSVAPVLDVCEEGKYPILNTDPETKAEYPYTVGDAVAMVKNIGYPSVADAAAARNGDVNEVITLLKNADYVFAAGDILKVYKANNQIVFTYTVPGGYVLLISDPDDNGVVTYTVAPAVARIGDTLYASLKDAVAAVPADGTETTIVMIADERIDVTGFAVTVPASKNVVLDLNGHEVIGQCSSGGTSALIRNLGTLTINDSSDPSTGKLIGGADPTWTWDGSDDYSGSYASNLIRNEGTLVVDGGYLYNASSGSASYAIDNYSAGKITVNGGTIDAKKASAIRLFYCNGGSITVKGGTIGHYTNDDDCTFMGIQVMNGTNAVVNVNGGTIAGNYALYSNASGSSAVNISGGTFDGYVGFAATQNNIAISGGKFMAWVGTWGDQTGFITGGLFAVAPDFEYCGKDEEGNQLYPMMNDDPETKDAFPYTVGLPVAVINGSFGYATLEAAFADAEDDDTVKLLKDVTIDSITVDKTVTLDLDRHEVKSDAAQLFLVTGDLTITGDGKITGPADGQSFDGKVLISVDGGNLTIENGTLTATGAGSDGMYGVYVLNGGTAVFGKEGVEGGPTITSHFAAIGTNHMTKPATITVYGGTYTANAAPTNNEWWSYFCAPIYAASAGDITIKGGTFNGYYGLSDRYADVEQEVRIEGGTFNASSNTQVFADEVNGSNDTPDRTIWAATNTLTVPKDYKWVGNDTNGYVLTLKDYVAENITTGEKYETLKEAVATAQDGDEIVMLKNEAASTSIIVNSEKNITIDLKGYTVSGGYVDLYSGFLTIKDTAEEKGAFNYLVYANVGDDTSKAAGEYNSFTLAEGAVMNSNVYVYQNNTDKGYGTKVAIDGTMNGLIFVLGNIHEGNTTIDVRGTINSNDDIAIALNGYAIVNVYDGAHIEAKDNSGNGTGIEVRAGELNVKGGTIKANGSFVAKANDSGTTTTGVAVAISQHTTNLPIKVTISGGTLTGEKALYEVDLQDETTENVTLSITEGYFTGKVESENLKAFITQGHFSEEPEASYIIPNKCAVLEGEWWIIDDAVAAIGDIGYASLAKAVAASKDDDTIKMLKDDTIARYIEVNTDVTLDLNGKTVAALAGGLDVYGEFTITDNSDGAAGKLVPGTWGVWANDGAKVTVEKGTIEAHTFAIIAQGSSEVVVNGGTITADNYGIHASGNAAVTLNGGTIEADDTGISVSSNAAVTVNNGSVSGTWGITVFDNASLTVNNGTVTGGEGGSAISTNGNAGQNATIVVNGGMITNEKDLGIYMPSGKLTVNGGTITGTTAVYVKSGKTTITGGTLHGTGEKADYSYYGNGANATGDALVVDNCGYPNGDPVVEITGGTFESDNAKGVGAYYDKTNKNELALVTSTDKTITVLENQMWIETDTAGVYKLVEAVVVTFVTEEGVAAPRAQRIEKGTKATKPMDPMKDNYIFLGWFEEGANEAFDFENTTVTEDITLTAKFEGKPIRIIYANYFTGDIIEEFNVHYDDPMSMYTISQAAIDSIPAREGYHFNLNDMWTIPVAEKATKDIVYVLKWIKGLTVQFVYDNGTDPRSVDVDQYSTVDKPEDPTKEGYDFIGWFNGHNEYEFSTPITASIILTAHWTPKKMTVTFNTNGGSVINAVQVDYDTAVDEPIAPTKENYVFAGWTLDGEQYNFAAAVKSDITLVAQWTEAVAKIGDVYYATLAEAFEAAQTGDTIVLLKDVTIDSITVDRTVTLDLDGHEVKSDAAQLFLVTGDLTITGDGKITGPADGQSFDGKVLISVDGGNLTIENGTLTATGAGSDGMYGVYVLNGGTAVFGKEGVEGGPTITSHFAAIGTNHMTKPATITVYGGTYTANAAPTNNEWWSYFCAPIYAASAGDITIKGGTFNGYYGLSDRYADVEQEVRIEGGTFNASSNTQVFADEVNGSNDTPDRTIWAATNTLTVPEGYIWVECENGYKLVLGVKVTFKNGDVEVTKQIEKGTKVEKPEEPTKDGNIFEGWYLDEELFDFESAVNEDVTLIAKWTEAVAKIGDVLYAKLADAVSAVQDGETIVLLKDTTTVNATNGKTYTIAMNGHTLTGITWVINDTTLIYDGSVEGSKYNGSVYVGYATNNNGNVELNGGSYTCGNGATVLHINGTCLNSNVTIKNATVTSPDDNGIQLNGSGEFVIENSTVVGATGVYVKSGHLTISGSTITGNMSPANYNYYGNGANATGDAIVIDSCEYPGGEPTVEIGEGNTFNGTKKQVGYYEYDGNNDGQTQDGIVTAMTNELTIPEGYVWLKVEENKYRLSDAVAKVGETYYGTFEEAFAAEGVLTGEAVVTLLKSGAEYMFRAGDIMKVQLADDDITFVYTADDGVVVTVTGPEEGVTTYTATTAVAKIGDVLYAKLADAVSAVQNGETIELLQNVSEDLLIGGGKSFTLDLCEHTMTGSIDQYDADVTINNGTIAGTIYANGLEDGKNGKLTIEADAKVVAAEHAIILWQADDNTGNGFTIDINGTVNGIAWVMGNITTGNSVINVNNGATITGDDVGIALNGCATVNVNDGATVTGTGTGIEVRAGELNVTGGTITGNGATTTVAANGSGTTTTGAGIAVAQHTTQLNVKVNISGGTINGTTALNVANPQNNETGEVEVAVTGGIFNGPVKMDETETRVKNFISGGDFIETVEPGYVVEGKLCTTTLTETINGTPYYYIVNAVTVTFDANEGQFPAAEGEEPKAIIEVVIPAGEKVVAAETPTREPYHFEGWFEENAAAAFDFENTAITADLTLKAKWHVDMYTVTVTSSGNGQPIAGATVANVTGGGSYALGAKITVSAPTVSGYTFLGWYVLNGDKLSDQQDYEYTVLAEGNNLIAVYTPVGGATFRLTVTGSKFTVSGINATQRSYFDRKLAVNGSITVTFTGNEKFLYWINSSNKIVSRSPAYTFMLVQDTDLTAVYSEADTAEALIVFVSAKVDGQVMSSFYATASDPIEFPMAPSSMGKTFKCWSIDGTNEATADVIHNAIASAQDGRIEVYPVYESTGKTYDVTVVCVDENGNEISSETPFTGVAVGSSSNVTAEATLDGKAFSFWADGVGEDRTILAYTLTYNVRPVENITLYAVYGAEADARPTIVMSQAYASMNGAKYRVSFTTTRSVPEGYTAESVGQLYVRGEYLDTTNDETIMQALVLNSENGNVKNVKTSNIESNSTHTLNINTSEMNRVFYARGYLVVNGPNGVETIYTDTYLFGSYNTLPNIDQ